MIAMRNALWNELVELSPAERIELAQDLWDSVEPEDISPLTAAEMQEIERRYADHLIHPKKAVTWEEVKARLLARYENVASAESRKDPTSL
jgi:putative addiction module component (TIGR02574 family)